MSRVEQRGRWRNESGSVTLIFALSVTVVAGMVVAGIVLGQSSIHKREMQNATDAAALVAAYHMQQRGRPASAGQFSTTTLPSAITRNTSLGPTPIFNIIDRWEDTSHKIGVYPSGEDRFENRVVIQVDLTGTWNSQQTWFNQLFAIHVTSYAQVNQQEFGIDWPALVVVLDASKSMGEDILGVMGQSAYGILRRAFRRYVGLEAGIPLGGGPPTVNTLPIRNGIVVYRNVQPANWVDAPPPVDQRNAAGVGSVFAAVLEPCVDHKPCPLKTDPGTNTSRALNTAADLLVGQNTGRNVLFITDGEPTLSGAGCNSVSDPCAATDHFAAARTAATGVRNTARAALFVVEIRRKAYSPANTALLRQMAGQPGTGGNDPEMLFQVQSELGIQTFMLGLSRSICSFGPLDPGPGAPADALRLRAGSPVLNNPAIQVADPRQQRVFAYILEPNGVTERRLRMVPNRDTVNDPSVFAFQYLLDPSGDAWVVLNLPACNYLGMDPERTVVVRWDDAQLTGRPL